MDNTPMLIQVPEDVLKRTTRCGEEFSCIKTERSACLEDCRIKSVLDQDLLVIETKHRNIMTCSYLTPFGSAQYCGCPTRYYLINHFRRLFEVAD